VSPTVIIWVIAIIIVAAIALGVVRGRS